MNFLKFLIVFCMAGAGAMAQEVQWPFPAQMPHHGIPQGNGTAGTLLYGGNDSLFLCINRQDFWDHRGGIDFSAEATYSNLKQWLYDGDEQKVRRVFEGEGAAKKDSLLPRRPSRLPMGRLAFVFPTGSRFDRAFLNHGNATATVVGAGYSLSSYVVRSEALAVVSLSGTGSEAVKCLLQPSSDFPEVKAYFSKHGIPPAQLLSDADGSGWVQNLPADSSLCVWTCSVKHAGGGLFYITMQYGKNQKEAVARAKAVCKKYMKRAPEQLKAEHDEFWKKWWEATAKINLPDPGLSYLYTNAMYKLACSSVPGSPAATLQGPWVEDYQMPAWSSDYHFNVNVQEFYMPVFASGHPECFLPLAELIRSWRLLLQKNAKAFLGTDEGTMLPHAVDDRCVPMGGFWPGMVDHGSTAWTALQLWQYYLYTGDTAFLRTQALPLITGTLKVYEKMLELNEDGNYSFPISVSPEWMGKNIRAWGRNGSYQLAVVHALSQVLTKAAGVQPAAEPYARQWETICRRLPKASVLPDGFMPQNYTDYGWDGMPKQSVFKEQIALWDDMPLLASHRHHSHLAGIYPFDVLDYGPGGSDEKLVKNSLNRWTELGYRYWTGWSFPWASAIWVRMGNGNAAASLLDLYSRYFTMPGGASTHDALHDGLSLNRSRTDLMQLEATMGAASAVMEMLMHHRKGILHVFPALPSGIQDASFENMPAEGAFQISAVYEHGHTRKIMVKSIRGGVLKIHHPEPELKLTSGYSGLHFHQNTIELSMNEGEMAEVLFEEK